MKELENLLELQRGLELIIWSLKYDEQSSTKVDYDERLELWRQKLEDVRSQISEIEKELN